MDVCRPTRRPAAPPPRRPAAPPPRRAGRCRPDPAIGDGAGRGTRRPRADTGHGRGHPQPQPLPRPAPDQTPPAGAATRGDQPVTPLLAAQPPSPHATPAGGQTTKRPDPRPGARRSARFTTGQRESDRRGCRRAAAGPASDGHRSPPARNAGITDGADPTSRCATPTARATARDPLIRPVRTTTVTAPAQRCDSLTASIPPRPQRCAGRLPTDRRPPRDRRLLARHGRGRGHPQQETLPLTSAETRRPRPV